MPNYNIHCFNCDSVYSTVLPEASVYTKNTEYGDRHFIRCLNCRKDAKVMGTKCNIYGGLSYEDKLNDQRAEYFNSAVQPFRNGELSKEFVDAHPNHVNKMITDGTIAPTEVAKAKEVWKDLPGHKDRKKSK